MLPMCNEDSSASTTRRPRAMQKSSDCGPLASLPADSIIQPYKDIQHVRLAAKEVLGELIAKQRGNQFIVLLNVPADAAHQLETDPHLLGDVQFRTMREGAVMRIKVVLSGHHDFPTSNIRSMIAHSISRMGYDWDDCQWGSTTLHEKTVSSRSKMPDECLYPPSRRPEHGQLRPWPSFVIETGVFESLPRLRMDATWWFANSCGDVRIVLIVSINKATRQVVLERWQLAPVDTLIPLSPETIFDLQEKNAPPPLEKQPFVSPDSAYCAQRIEICRTSNTVTGGPLRLPFQPVMDSNIPPEGSTIPFDFSDEKLLRCLRYV